MKLLSDQRFQELAEDIREGKCIIFLGPGATINYGDPNRQAKLFGKLAANHSGDILAYHADDGLLVFSAPNMRSLYERTIRDFYGGGRNAEAMPLPPNPLLEKLALLPFQVALSVTPDLSMQDVFDAKGYAYFMEYYAPKIKVDLPHLPSAECPLIYHLMGSVNEPQTIICCHDDMFRYLKSIFRDMNLPDQVATMFNAERTKSIIFLGFEFDKWYFQLIVYILGIKMDHRFRYAVPPPPPKAQNEALLEAQFNIEFIDNDLLEFVENLLEYFDESELRKPMPQNEHGKVLVIGRVIKLLSNAFVQGELDQFCMVHYWEVYKEFSPGLQNAERVKLLIEHIEIHGLWDELLNLMACENPYQFKKWAPYYESSKTK